MTEENFRKWVEIARWAPSGGNAQPWRLVRLSSPSDLCFRLLVDPLYAKAPSNLDLDGAASLIALGAFFESLDLVARLDGAELQVQGLHDSSDFFAWSIDFKVSQAAAESPSPPALISSANTVLRRTTNRFAYLEKEVPEEFCEWMCLDFKQRGFALKFFESADERAQIIEHLSALEKIRWEQPAFLSSVLEELKEQPAEEDTQGIPFSQLPLRWNEVLLIRALKSQRWLWNLMPLGISGQIAKSAVKVPIQGAPSFFYIHPLSVASQAQGKGFFDLGRSMQRLWLAAEEKGLALQPLAGHLLPHQALKNPAAFRLTAKQEVVMAKVAGRFQELWGLDLMQPLFGFRMGYPTQAAPTSFRKGVDEILPSVQDVLAS